MDKMFRYVSTVFLGLSRVQVRQMRSNWLRGETWSDYCSEGTSIIYFSFIAGGEYELILFKRTAIQVAQTTLVINSSTKMQKKFGRQIARAQVRNQTQTRNKGYLKLQDRSLLLQGNFKQTLCELLKPLTPV